MDDFVNMSINVESSGLQVVKWVGRITSLPRKFVEEIVLRSNIQAETVENLTLDEIRRIYFNTKSLIEEITTSSKHNPTLIEDEDGNPVDVLPIPTNATANARAIMVKEYMEGGGSSVKLSDHKSRTEAKNNSHKSRVSALLHDISEQDRAKEQVIAKAHIIKKSSGELMSIPYEGPDIEFSETFTKLIQEKSVNIFNRKVQDIWRLLVKI